jgi:putative Holliday junction resolvase
VRFLAIDLGDRRTGLAVGDDETGLATPLSVVECAPGELVERLAGAIDDHAPDAIVIGLPLNMDGSEGPRAKAARVTGAELAARFARTVHYQDERLTSFAAEGQLARSGHTRKGKKRRLDALAAAEILRDFLDERRHASPNADADRDVPPAPANDA